METYLKRNLQEHEALTTEHRCELEGAASEFADLQTDYQSKGNQSIHMIQSWSPAESKSLTRDHVHAMGIKLASRFAPGHQFIVQTHDDQPHYHNHIMINPVSIDTGKLTKRFRQLRHTALANGIAVAIARNMKLTEFGARVALGAGHAVQGVFGLGFMRGVTRLLDKISRGAMDEAFWQWCAEMPRPRRGTLPTRPNDDADAVYFPACISRIMGALPGEQQETTVMQAFLNVAGRAGVKLYVPDDIKGNCCGVPFSSKGFEAAHDITVDRTIENFYRWSDGGRLPIVVDTSPCTYGLKTARAHLNPENQARFDKLTILDSVEFAHDSLLPTLPIRRKVHSVALHPVCSAAKMAIVSKLVRISSACSESVLVPRDAGCCAFAGDRGFLFPELTASASGIEASQATANEHDGYFSSSRTCEIGMTRATGKVYQSYLHLLDYASQP